MPHFGKLVQGLRDERGLTQSQLADRAGASINTIQRGEASTTCPWRKRLAEEVFQALNRRAPISEDDTLAYYALAGMKPHEPSPSPPLSRAQRAAQLLSEHGDPDQTTAAVWIDRLLEEAGSARVLAALQALAISWGIDLPDRARRKAPASTPPIHALRTPADLGPVKADIYTPLPGATPKRPTTPARPTKRRSA